MTDWVPITSEESFHHLVLGAREPVVVAFETASCGPCRQQRTLLALTWVHLGWSAATFRVDADQLPALAHRYRIVGYPTIAVFFRGELVERLPGRGNRRALMRRLASLLDPTPQRTDR